MDPGCRPESVWIATAPGEPRPPLEGRVEADVAIVGAGIVGVTAAHLLRQSGHSVALLDRGRIAGGVSGKTTAKVTSQHGLSLDGLVRRFGEERIRLHVQANEAAKDLVLRLAVDLEADGTAAPNYVYTTDKERVGELRQEADTAARLGLPASLTTETELPFPVAAAVRFERQAHMHPRKYLLGLLDRIEGPLCQAFEQSPVTAIEEDREGGSCTVRTPEGEVAARHVLVATHVPILDRIAYTPRIQPKREYGIALGAGDCRMEGMYVSADSPRRSVRPWVGEHGPMLVFVGETHPVGESQAKPHYQALAEFAKDFSDDAVRYCWSSQDAYPVDGLPLVGRHAPRARRVFAATGFRAWGMTQGTVAAQLLTDLVLGKENPLAALYDPFGPARILKDLATPGFVQAGATAVKGLVVERLAPHPVKDLAPGEGRVETHGLHKVAVSRGSDGALRACMAACTHMGCIVAWNPLEKSWDCPCHGSRFAPDGAVLHGPATKPLKPYDLPAGDPRQDGSSRRRPERPRTRGEPHAGDAGAQGEGESPAAR